MGGGWWKVNSFGLTLWGKEQTWGTVRLGGVRINSGVYGSGSLVETHALGGRVEGGWT